MRTASRQELKSVPVERHRNERCPPGMHAKADGRTRVRLTRRHRVMRHVWVPTLFRRELEYRNLMKPLIRPQDGRWKVRMIRRIRKMLRLKAESISPLVDVPLLACHRAIEKISSVELDSRLRRRNLQHTPGRWVGNS